MNQIVDTAQEEFSLSEARNLIADLFQPKIWFYWTDFLLTYGAGIFCFQQVRGGPIWAPHQGVRGDVPQLLFFAASCLLFYRAGIFIHEVVHHRNNSNLTAFRFVWNLLCGIPFLIPSFVYLTHIDHHRRHHFGTDRDGEYLPLGRQRVSYLLFYLSWSFAIPILTVMRFLVLTPLAWVIPGFRKFVHQHASSMVMDPTYIRPLPKAKTLRLIYIQEFACFLWCLGIALYAPLALGRLPIPFLIHAYLMSVVIVMLNSIRTLGSHRWHNDGGEMSFVDQLLDSVNYPRHAWISELWGPVGTRFHALHHLFPSLPYHAMPEAHRRLMRSLPADSPYRRAEETSLTSGIADLVKRSRSVGSEPNVDNRQSDASLPSTAWPAKPR